MPIYTKKGDQGKTSLFSGKRVLKSDIRVEAYGTVDEANSLIGVSIANLKKANKKSVYLKKWLLDVQETLFFICSYLAGLSDALNSINLDEKTEKLEREIDEMTENLPKLSNFILPGGGVAGATLQHARTVTRRAERQLVRLAQNEKGLPAGRQVDERVIKYINRLSDFLFTAARFTNFIEKKKERIWSR